MTWRRLALAVVAAGFLGGCSNDASGPQGNPGDPGDPGNPGGPGAGEVSAAVTDPSGDTFGNRGPQWDLTGMTVTRDTAGITVVLDFASAPISPVTGDSNAMIGFVDFDTDQDSTTGGTTIVDEFRRDGGSTGMDNDFRIDLATYGADSSVKVFNSSGAVTGEVKPAFSGTRVTIRVPRVMLGNDDGFLYAAAIVGSQASPTDIVPESGHLQLVEESATGGSLTRVAATGPVLDSRPPSRWIRAR